MEFTTPVVGGAVEITRVPGLTVTVTLALTATGAVESWTLIVPDPGAVGVPLITPVFTLNESPGGRPDAENVYGAMPPVAETVVDGYTDPETPIGKTDGLMTKAGSITSGSVIESGVPEVESLTVTEALPEEAGVPLSTPVVVSNESPAGSPLAESTYGRVPPEADTVTDAYGTFTVAVGSEVGETINAGLMLRGTPMGGDGDVESFTVMVAVPDAVGVPLRTPVEALKERPAGRLDAERV